MIYDYDYDTCQKDQYFIPKSKIKLAQFSLRFNGATIWNTCHKYEIAKETSECSF